MTENQEYNKEQSEQATDFPETQETLRPQWEPLQGEIDVVIMTVTDVELNAVARLLKPYPRKTKILQVYSEQETYYLGKFGEYKTVVSKCRMGSTGEGSATLATQQALSLWNPKAIIMVGIAFGKDSTKQKIGDVLVASQIIPYELQRAGKGKITYRSSIPPSNTTLLNRFENIHGWKFTRPDSSQSEIIRGPILSGEKLIDDPVFKAKLFKQYPEAVGGEMEGAGLCAAAGREGIAWILVKSICDWGDGEKNNPDKDKHQQFAAATATSLVHYMLSQKTVLDGIQKKTLLHP
jgi:nucleoside phosphorylase